MDTPDPGPRSASAGVTTRTAAGPEIRDHRRRGLTLLLPRLAGRLVARRRPGPGEAAGFDAALVAARGANAILVAEYRHVATIAAAMRHRIAVVLPDDANHDGLACFVEALGGKAVQAAGVAGAAAIEGPGAALLLPISDRPDVAWDPADAVQIAARSARPLVLVSARASRPWRFGLGLPAPVEIPSGASAAIISQTIRCPRGPVGAALASEQMARLRQPCGRFPGIAIAEAKRSRRTLPLRLYGAGMAILGPAARPYLYRRARRGKEDRARIGERLGCPSRPRPDGRLVWLHAASVGESVSILPLIDALIARGLTDAVLVTTGTTTSARIMDQRLPAGAIHQFVPLDAPRFASRFLDHWRPALAVFVESELWPNLMGAARRRDIPIAIVNGRISGRSFARWRSLPRTAHAVMATVSAVVAQAPAHASRFALLGADHVRHEGNLKFDCPPPPFNGTELGDLDEATRLRPVWLAASTHDGEEAIVAEAHLAIRDRFPDLLTIVAPRHPERGADIAKTLAERRLAVARRSAADPINPAVDVYLADTIGELGLFFQLAGIAFVGGSLVPAGGHNPIEPAHLDCAILHGPHVRNFVDMYEAFDAGGGSTKVSTPAELAAALADLLSDAARTAAMAAANKAVIARNDGALARTVAALEPLLAR